MKEKEADKLCKRLVRLTNSLVKINKEMDDLHLLVDKLTDRNCEIKPTKNKK